MTSNPFTIRHRIIRVLFALDGWGPKKMLHTFPPDIQAEYEKAADLILTVFSAPDEAMLKAVCAQYPEATKKQRQAYRATFLRDWRTALLSARKGL